MFFRDSKCISSGPSIPFNSFFMLISHLGFVLPSYLYSHGLFQYCFGYICLLSFFSLLSHLLVHRIQFHCFGTSYFDCTLVSSFLSQYFLAYFFRLDRLSLLLFITYFVPLCPNVFCFPYYFYISFKYF